MLDCRLSALVGLFSAALVAAGCAGGGSTASPPTILGEVPPSIQSPSPRPTPSAPPSGPPSSSPTPGGLLAITSGSPPVGKIGTAYGGLHVGTCQPGHGTTGCPYQWFGFDLSVNLGSPTSYFWSWAPAVPYLSLPPGLRVVNAHVVGYQFCGNNCYYPLIVPARITGKPTGPNATYHVIVTVVDSGSPQEQARASYTITIL